MIRINLQNNLYDVCEIITIFNFTERVINIFEKDISA